MRFAAAAKHGAIAGRPTRDDGRRRTSVRSAGSASLTRLEALPGLVGVSVGCFADPTFEKPQKLYWTVSRHHWLDTPRGVEPVDTQ